MITSILHIDASARHDDSVSRATTAQIIASLSPTSVVHRDLVAEPLPHVDATWVAARLVPEDERSDTERQSLALSDALVSEIMDADTLVIGMPIYNFGMPAALKAWVDLVARPKVTFAYTPDGPKGLVEGKKAIVVVASGGVKMDSVADYATPHLRQVLGFLGITDVTFMSADDAAQRYAA
ncbi:FMN-dependent NADH-azoreductase [Yoonia sp. 208BN28-4]|uniref:FMN-dependent NADH-azoreductase n=1 Tax=Yoonia sp. 208BN28-4 TaxID=3126505 RepID=UPI00309DEC89